jgi:hypothetical protein
MFQQISSRIRLQRNSRDLLHAAKLRHGTDSFTSPPKEGVLRTFSPLKIRRPRPGLNARTWVPNASNKKIYGHNSIQANTLFVERDNRFKSTLKRLVDVE